ncbi:MAG TPA: PIN domain-containing protein, partial [Candidatus Nanopelagicales bacterium]|nr:PIN domain-containing protein [Candidatus Nanopelagicales bacterium]
SALLRADSLRAVRYLGPPALATVREGLRRVDLIGIDDRILDAAGTLEPQVLRTLDAIHLATAMAVGDDLAAIVTYDERMIDAARRMGLATASPR